MILLNNPRKAGGGIRGAEKGRGKGRREEPGKGEGEAEGVGKGKGKGRQGVLTGESVKIGWGIDLYCLKDEEWLMRGK